MKKIEKIKKKLIKAAILYVVILSTSGACYYFSNNALESFEQDKSSLENAVNTSQTEISSLTEKIKGAIASSQVIAGEDGIYNLVGGVQNIGKGLHIDSLKPLMSKLENYYVLANRIQLDVSEPATCNSFQSKDIRVQISYLDLKFSGISDEYLLGLMKTVQKSLPGFSNIIALSLNKVSEINTTTLQKFNQNSFPVIVEGRIKIEWKDFKDI